jgi:large subunit ribosomal protein L10
VLYPATQPPSHKRPEERKTQLHRQYQSLLKSSPLMLIFQHNNVKAVEWTSIRRELAVALRKIDAERVAAGQEAIADQIKLQVIQTNIFASALKVVEFFNPAAAADQTSTVHETDPRTPTSARVPLAGNKVDDPYFTHGLSRHAHSVANNRSLTHDLEPLLSGPLAVVTFPLVTPQHLHPLPHGPAVPRAPPQGQPGLLRARRADRIAEADAAGRARGGQGVRRGGDQVGGRHPWGH